MPSRTGKNGPAVSRRVRKCEIALWRPHEGFVNTSHGDRASGYQGRRDKPKAFLDGWWMMDDGRGRITNPQLGDEGDHLRHLTLWIKKIRGTVLCNISDVTKEPSLCYISHRRGLSFTSCIFAAWLFSGNVWRIGKLIVPFLYKWNQIVPRKWHHPWRQGN